MKLTLREKILFVMGAFSDLVDWQMIEQVYAHIHIERDYKGRHFEFVRYNDDDQSVIYAITVDFFGTDHESVKVWRNGRTRVRLADGTIHEV